MFAHPRIKLKNHFIPTPPAHIPLHPPPSTPPPNPALWCPSQRARLRNKKVRRSSAQRCADRIAPEDLFVACTRIMSSEPVGARGALDKRMLGHMSLVAPENGLALVKVSATGSVIVNITGDQIVRDGIYEALLDRSGGDVGAGKDAVYKRKQWRIIRSQPGL